MTVRSALLQLLDEGPAHGYQLKATFEARTGGVWPLNVGQVYTTLDRLVRDGAAAELVPAGTDAPEPVNGQRTYAITRAGQAELAAWLIGAASEQAPPRDELMTKVLVAVGRDERSALEVIDAQRAALFAALQSERRRQQARTEPAEVLAHDALSGRLEADLAWLDRCEEHVRSSSSDRPHATTSRRNP